LTLVSPLLLLVVVLQPRLAPLLMLVGLLQPLQLLLLLPRC
jgi:hypothetical protein